MTSPAFSTALRGVPLLRRATILLAAAAIALAGLTATTRPARADVEELLRFLAGVAVIAAIVNAIDDNHSPRYVSRWVLPDSCLETMRVNWRTVQAYNARCLQRAGYRNLPRQCRVEFQVNNRNRAGYVADCMWEAGYRRESAWSQPQPEPVVPTPGYRWLPGHCEMTYRQDGRRLNGYWATCLRDAGLRNLPDHCRLTASDGRRLFNAQCLINAGYRAAR